MCVAILSHISGNGVNVVRVTENVNDVSCDSTNSIYKNLKG